MVHVFESCGFEYKVIRPIQLAREEEPVLLAARREYFGEKTTLVELRPLPGATQSGSSVKARLREELHLSQHLRHPNIGKVLGFAVDGKHVYRVMEHLVGCTLETALDAAALARRKVSVGFAATVALAVAEALEHAHQCVDERGRPLHVVHRAVSPANIHISQRGHVHLVNFGSAWSEMLERLRTPEGLLRGDAAYLAPEVLREFLQPRKNRRAKGRTPPDRRADVFSLGLVLLGVLAGWHPMDPPDSVEAGVEMGLPPGLQVEMTPTIPLRLLAHRILHFGPQDVQRAARKLPLRLRRIIAKALQVEPSERYPSALAMAEELRGFLSEECPTYREAEVAQERAELIRAAKKLRENVAYSVTEPGILPVERA
jgi:eukaryotic-like serine/threonine-protein kinase